MIIAQSSIAYTQTKDSSIVTTDETVAFLLAQTEQAKKVISEQENRIKDLEAEIAVERENSESLTKSYTDAQNEIARLRASNDALSRAVTIHENTIALLQSDNTKQKEKATKANKEKWKARAVAAGLLILEVLRIAN